MNFNVNMGQCTRLRFLLHQEEAKALMSLHIIRIYHECEGRIEKSVSRITVWHHKAHMNNGFFFLLITVFNYLI